MKQQKNKKGHYLLIDGYPQRAAGNKNKRMKKKSIFKMNIGKLINVYSENPDTKQLIICLMVVLLAVWLFTKF